MKLATLRLASTYGMKIPKKILVVDVGGTHVKICVSGQREVRKMESGQKLTPLQMVAGVKKLADDWKFDAASIGYPGPVVHNHIVSDPFNLGKGWVGFNFSKAFDCHVRIVNDAAMQALGAYKEGKMLFLGLGTGLGSAMIVEGVMAPMELGHLPYKKATFEDYVGLRGLEKHGKRKWRGYVEDVISRFMAALEPEEAVIGGGNVKLLKELPDRCRAGDNADAFIGGYRLWENSHESAFRGIFKSRKVKA